MEEPLEWTSSPFWSLKGRSGTTCIGSGIACPRGATFHPRSRRLRFQRSPVDERTLGIPTVSDRIAQTVVKLVLEPQIDPHFHADSYGYRPGKSAHQAIEVTRKRCWWHDWVLEFDIRGLFDNIDHGLLMKAVRRHTDCKWVLLYIERWLTAPMQNEDGTLCRRDRGTPQGGVISPLLANLFLHYAFDRWMAAQFSESAFLQIRRRRTDPLPQSQAGALSQK